MYIIFGIFIVAAIFFFLINHHRRRCIIAKICCMSDSDKCELLNDLIEPFGYCYNSGKDIFSTPLYAWQRDFGYTSLYDKMALGFNMVFDREPVYFNYAGKTWLLEFWKGQYGINTGAEIGIYHAYRILDENELKSAVFHCVTDEEMLDFSIRLCCHGKPITSAHCRHWWLPVFCMGKFSHPQALSLEISITFPNPVMAAAFVNALLDLDYCECNISSYDSQVSFTFEESHTDCHKFIECLHRDFAQWKNKWFCRIYLFFTRPFCLSADRLLYLYFFLPAAFRKTVQVRRPYKGKRY